MKKSIVLVGLSYALDNYMVSHIELLKKHSNVTVLAVDSDPKLKRFFHRRSLISTPFEMMFLFVFLLRNRPDTCISVGPKLGGMLSILCRLVKVKHAHWFTGQVWCNANSPKLTASYWCDRVITTLSPILLSDGPSQAEFLKCQFRKNLKEKDISVPGLGSINGVPNKFFSKVGRKSSDPLKVCFVGRKAKGKGLDVITQVAQKLCSDKSIEFILAGPTDLSFDDYSNWKSDVEARLSNIHFIDDFVDPIEIFEDANVLLLPSEREGFGSVVIEAQSMGLPVICSDIYGLKDAFIDGVTGFSCEQKSVDSYVKAILRLKDRAVFDSMSESAQKFSRNFEHQCFNQYLLNCYTKVGVIS
ncbi:glycosyltransferase [Vibrio atlanticus]|uniref:glycosyltransferase n=1 Tax=Vibrio atlanticus TaxID=693153 RepID=UPI003D1111E6